MLIAILGYYIIGPFMTGVLTVLTYGVDVLVNKGLIDVYKRQEGKHQLTKKVYVDDQDMEDLKYISSKGVHVYIQDVPGDVKTEI